MPLALAMVASASSSFARDPNFEACASASQAGQRAALVHHLLEANREFLQCTQATCPAVIRRDCDELLSRVDADTPTFTLRVRDAEGRDVEAAEVTVDGAPFPRALSGQTLALDPGPHRIRAARGADVAEQSVVLGEREKARVVELRFPSIRAPSRSIPSSVYVFGGLGIASVGAFATLAALGQSTYDECASGACTPSRHSALEAERAAAWTSLGVGVAFLGVATAILLNSRHAEPGAGTTVAVGAGRLAIQGSF